MDKQTKEMIEQIMFIRAFFKMTGILEFIESRVIAPNPDELIAADIRQIQNSVCNNHDEDKFLCQIQERCEDSRLLNRTCCDI